jgi:SNF2 family DNA or RNA helicase
MISVHPGFGVIILSGAVGFGVNVQKANHVIHFRLLEPSQEDQATDRVPDWAN